MKPAKTFADDMLKRAEQKYQAIHVQREEILAAFVAKYGFHPDECQQIVQGNKWYVVRLDPKMVKTVQRNLIEAKFWAHGPTRWQRFCLWMTGLK